MSVGPHPSPQVHTFNTSPLKSVGPSKRGNRVTLCLNKVEYKQSGPSTSHVRQKVDPTIVGSRTQRESRSVAYQHTWQIVGEEVTPTRLWVTRGKYSSPPPLPHIPMSFTHRKLSLTHALIYFFLRNTQTHFISAKTAKPQNLDTLPIHYYSLFQ